MENDGKLSIDKIECNLIYTDLVAEIEAKWTEKEELP